MKFGAQLELSWVSSWREHYVDYRLLKKLIARVMVAQGTLRLKRSMATTPRFEDSERNQFEIIFFLELDQVDAFYSRLRTAFQAKLFKFRKLNHPTAEQCFKFREELRIWREYVDLNYTASRKILKKYDKKTKFNAIKTLLPRVQKRTFYSADDIDVMDAEIVKYLKQAMARDGLAKDAQVPDLVDFNLEGKRREDTMDRLVEMMDRSDWVWYMMPLQMTRYYLNRMLAILDDYDAKTYAFWLTAFVILQIVILHFYKFPLQYTSQYVTTYLRQFQSRVVEVISDFMHHKLSTGNWFLFCCCLMWIFPTDRRWRNMYCFVGTGFVVKSLAKSYLRSPRGFWLWTEGSGTYCGKGWSLPSGHSMVSLCLLGFLVKELKTPSILFVTLVFEIAVFLNVTYIGTHTYMDVIVGWTFALWCLSLFALMEELARDKLGEYFKPSKKTSRHIRSWLIFLVLVLFTVVVSDYLEELSHPETLPDYFQINMEKYCGFEPGKGGHRMRLRLKWTNIPLIMGMACGYALNELFFAPEDEDPIDDDDDDVKKDKEEYKEENTKKESEDSLPPLSLTRRGEPSMTVATKGWQKIVLCVGGCYIFMSLFSWCKVLSAFIGVPGMAIYFHNFFSPLIVLFLWPFSFSIICYIFSHWLLPAQFQKKVGGWLEELSLAQLGSMTLAVAIAYTMANPAPGASSH
jgi:membrane-associated phospholipid phosphatase